MINGVIGAGLRLEFYHEFPSFGVEPGPAGTWRATGETTPYPLMFSLKATKS